MVLLVSQSRAAERLSGAQAAGPGQSFIRPTNVSGLCSICYTECSSYEPSRGFPAVSYTCVADCAYANTTPVSQSYTGSHRS